jgi:Zn-dependent peptidase ImmA (M78 family)
VSFVLLKGIPGCPVSGAAVQLSPTKRLLAVSARYLRDDAFWFSFYHEAAHLILHKNQPVFVDSGEDDDREAREQEANDFARAALIPTVFDEELENLRPRRDDIIRFSNKIGVCPGIVVGQLEYRQVIAWGRLARLKRRYRWDNDTIRGT